MNNKLGELGTAFITVSSVPYKEFDKMTKLLNGEISRQTSLSTLLAYDSNTDISSLNHGDVVASVADTAHTLLGILANQLGDLGFLVRRATTGDDGWELNGNGDELDAEVGE